MAGIAHAGPVLVNGIATPGGRVNCGRSVRVYRSESSVSNRIGNSHLHRHDHDRLRDRDRRDRR